MDWVAPGLNHRQDPYGHVPPASQVAPVRLGGSLIHPCPAAPAARPAATSGRIAHKERGGRKGRAEGAILFAARRLTEETTPG
eukprot:gene11365-21428_t